MITHAQGSIGAVAIGGVAAVVSFFVIHESITVDFFAADGARHVIEVNPLDINWQEADGVQIQTARKTLRNEEGRWICDYVMPEVDPASVAYSESDRLYRATRGACFPGVLAGVMAYAAFWLACFARWIVRQCSRSEAASLST